jgi:ubiquinol-cytochrome c reductase cytochrome b/c1 subunit
VPEWYFLPFYAILRAVPDKLGGVIAMAAAIVIWCFLPWLDTSRIRSTAYRPLYKIFFWVFFAVCVLLGWLGAKPAEGWYVIASQIFTVYYFAHFLVILPLLGLFERPLPLPNSILESVMGVQKGGSGMPGGRSRRAAIQGLTRDERGPYDHEQDRRSHRRRPGGGPRPRRPGPCRRRDPGAAAAEVELPGPLRDLRPRPAPARLQGLPGGLRLLPLLELRGLPQPREPGGPEFSEAQVRALAAEYKIQDGPNEAGDMFERPGRPADRFPKPFPNENAAAAANGGKAPPDLSLMAKARTYERGFPWFVIDVFRQYSENGADYLTALMTGYKEAPPGITVPPAAITTSTIRATSSRCRTRSATGRWSIRRTTAASPWCPRPWRSTPRT